MQYLQPAGQPRLVTMKVYGPLIIGMRYAVERQQVVHRDRQRVEVRDERPRSAS